MALIGYRVDALRARLGALWHRWLGLQVGSGVQIHPGARLRHGPGCAIGDASILYRGVQVLATEGGTFQIGSGSHIAPMGYLLVGPSQLLIGDGVAIGPQLALFCQTNGTRPAKPFAQQRRQAPVRIGNNVYIGAHVTVLPGAHIEDNVVVAAQSVVRGRLASGWIYGGAPARPLRQIQA